MILDDTFTYDGPENSPGSAVTIHAGSLSVNQTYQLLVSMISNTNSTAQLHAYLTVGVVNSEPPLIVVG